MPSGIYIGLTAAELATMRADTITLLQNLRRAHQSYGIAGRQISRVAMKDAQMDLAEINYAIQLQTGALQTVIESDLSQ